MGIYISAETEHPEYAVAMIDYQYSDEMVNLMNWGVEGAKPIQKLMKLRLS